MLYCLLPIVANCQPILRLIITILRHTEFLYSSKIHTRFEPKISNISIRFLRSKTDLVSVIQSLPTSFAASFQKYGVTPNAVHLADALTPSHFTEATRFVKRHAGNVFGEDARL